MLIYMQVRMRLRLGGLAANDINFHIGKIGGFIQCLLLHWKHFESIGVLLGGFAARTPKFRSSGARIFGSGLCAKARSNRA